MKTFPWFFLFFLGTCSVGFGQDVPASHVLLEQKISKELLKKYRYSLKYPQPKATLEAVSEPVSGDRALELIFTHCSACHRPEGSAPFPLVNYEQVKRKASTIKRVVQDRLMPPWLVSSAGHSFANEPAISDRERQEIIAWVEQGTQPPAQSFSPVYNDSTFQQLIQEREYLEFTWDGAAEIYSDTDTYQCYRLEMGLEEDVYVDMIEYISSNNPAVHHVTILMEEGVEIDENPLGEECHNLDLVEIAIPMDTWTKGVRPMSYEDGFAYRIPAGATLLVSVHYASGFQGQKESRKVRFYLSEHPSPREVKWTVQSDQDIFVPKEGIVTDVTQVHLPNDYTLFGLMPHMHFLAKECLIYTLTPDNEIKVILYLDEWDYLWQSKYMFDQPIFIPGGSTVFMNVIYDNREENPTQPNDPVRDVQFGQTGNEEMLVLLLYGTDYQKGDEKVRPVKVY